MLSIPLQHHKQRADTTAVPNHLVGCAQQQQQQLYQKWYHYQRGYKSNCSSTSSDKRVLNTSAHW